MGLWEQLFKAKVRRCISFKIIESGEGLLSLQLENHAKNFLLGSFVYSRDYLGITNYERKDLMRIPFLGLSKDEHHIYESKKTSENIITRFDISPMGETALMITYEDELIEGNIAYIVEFKLESWSK